MEHARKSLLRGLQRGSLWKAEHGWLKTCTFQERRWAKEHPSCTYTDPGTVKGVSLNIFSLGVMTVSIPTVRSIYFNKIITQVATWEFIYFHPCNSFALMLDLYHELIVFQILSKYLFLWSVSHCSSLPLIFKLSGSDEPFCICSFLRSEF